MSAYFKKKQLSEADLLHETYIYTGHASKFQPDCEIGLEVELEGFNAANMVGYIKPRDYWRAENDPSLRGDCIEMVLHQPIKYAALDTALKRFDAIAEEAKFKPAISRRCSLHVHFDFSRKKFYSLIKFLTLYAMLEPHFFEAVAPERKGNQFCVAFSESDLFVSEIVRAIQTRKFFSFTNELRYMACNLSSLNKFGSIEIRMHPGTASTKQMRRWVEALYELVHYADTNYDYTPSQYLEQVSMRGFKEFVSITFPKCWDLIKDVYDKVPYRLTMDAAQDIAYAVSWENAPKGVSVEPKKPTRKRSGRPAPEPIIGHGDNQHVRLNEAQLADILRDDRQQRAERIRQDVNWINLQIGEDPERPF